MNHSHPIAQRQRDEWRAFGDGIELDAEAEELTCSACGDEISEREWTEHGGRCYCCGREPKDEA